MPISSGIPARWRDWALVGLDLLILATWVVLPWFWLFGPHWLRLGPVTLPLPWYIRLPALPLVLLLLRLGLRHRAGHMAHGLMRLAWYRKLTLATASLAFFLGGGEFVLHLIGFHVELPRVVFEGRQDPTHPLDIAVDSDAELLWKFRPGAIFAGRVINRLGFREREVEPVKASGVRRVLCMGDSVTAQGRPCYSELLDRRLSAAPPTRNRWEAFNTAVYGYSSLQGLRLFELRGRALRPDVVTLYFGWNDHWLNHESDRQQMALEVPPFVGRGVEALRDKKLFQFLVWALNPMEHLMERMPLNKSTAIFDPAHHFVPRVAPDEYRRVLTRLVREIRAVNAIPVLITAPRRHLSTQLETKHYAYTVEDAERRHDDYVRLTRQVAAAAQVEMLDLARIFAGPECDAYFHTDGIHFDFCGTEATLSRDPDRQPGLERIAAELDQKIRSITQTAAWRAKEKREASHPADSKE
ncbi:MAG: SGNH/GDSL hydrolase family protein [Verrucomicrobia bacterium]|nr:MAG: SGNH/GDSL hydrolase family protein [Verrucomicrobiota bacterium]